LLRLDGWAIQRADEFRRGAGVRWSHPWWLRGVCAPVFATQNVLHDREDNPTNLRASLGLSYGLSTTAVFGSLPVYNLTRLSGAHLFGASHSSPGCAFSHNWCWRNMSSASLTFLSRATASLAVRRSLIRLCSRTCSFGLRLSIGASYLSMCCVLR